MKPVHTRLLLALGLIGTLTLVWLAPGEDDGLASPAGKATGGRQATAVRSKTSGPLAAAGSTIARPGQLDNPPRPPLGENIPDLFAGFSWYVPPPPPPDRKSVV